MFFSVCQISVCVLIFGWWQFEGELLLCPGFLSPPFTDYAGYHDYIDGHLPPESPALYGLHPNAELECLTVTTDSLLRTLLELQPQDSSRGEGAAQSTEEKVRRPREETAGETTA